MSNEIDLHPWKPTRFKKNISYLSKHLIRTCTNALALYSCKMFAKYHTSCRSKIDEGAC
jgi:hypothetical protein